MTDTAELLSRPFGTVDVMIAHHARVTPERVALILDRGGAEPLRLTYAELDALTDRAAAALQRDGLQPGDTVALCAAYSLEFVVTMLGVLRAGLAAAPLATWLEADSFAAVLADCGARLLFADPTLAAALPVEGAVRVVPLDGAGGDFDAWLAPPGTVPIPFEAAPDQVAVLLYSSGTTGTPKGVVQRRATWWALKANVGAGDGVMMVSTPSYSTTGVISLLPTLTTGGTAVLMPKFDALHFLELAQAWRATHAILVPVQYQRIMAEPSFDRFDLTSFRRKFTVAAPMAPELKAEVARRWPGTFREVYNMSEGCCSFWLEVQDHPSKLHTVGLPAPGSEIRIIDEAGREVAQGEVGEIAGRSRTMMAGYHGRPEATAAIEWFDAEGRRFIRTGDLGYLDPDGFLVLAGRARDMIISGGLNVHAIDLETVLERHPDVAEAAVVAAPCDRWGETPVAFVVARADAAPDAQALRNWANRRVGKMQRLARVELVEALPRSPIGKVLKRQLREAARAL